MPRNTTARNRARRRKTPPAQGLAAFLADRAGIFFDDPESPALLVVKRLVGIALLPVCWILVETFLVLLGADTLAGAYWRSREFLFFGMGAAAWLVMLPLDRSKPLRWLYVAGHELTHALFVLVFRGRITRLRVSSEGGHILTNRNNFLISLSPYFFPFYTVVAIVVWMTMNWVVAEVARPDPSWLYGLIGFTWAFHLTYTLWMIRRDQPDVRQNGRTFSFAVIFSANLLLICAMLIVASPTASFRSFFVSFWENARTFLPRLVESARELWSMLPF